MPLYILSSKLSECLIIFCVYVKNLRSKGFVNTDAKECIKKSIDHEEQ